MNIENSLVSVLFFLLSTLALSNGNTLQDTIDVKKLQNILQESVKSKDVSTLYYAVKGLSILKASLPNICEVRIINLSC